MKSGTNYYHLKNGEILPQEIIDGIDVSQPENFLIATYNNQTRFLLKDSALAIVESNDAMKMHGDILEQFGHSALSITQQMQHNNLTFYLDPGHAQVEFNCRSCEKGELHSYFYEIVNNLTKSKNPFCTGNSYWFNNHEKRCSHVPGNPLQFYLTDEQAIRVYDTISTLFSLASQDKYTYVKFLHNCVSLPMDIYSKSGFDHTFAHYLLDEELLGNSEVGETALIYKRYYTDDYLDPRRKKVEEFCKAVLGDDFADHWHHNDRDGKSLPIKYLPVDLKQAKANPLIADLLHEISQIRKEIYSPLFKESLKIWGVDDKKHAAILDKAVKNMIEAPINYNDLFYTYVIKHEFAIQNAFKDEPYASSLLPLFGDSLEGICDHPKVGDLYYHDACAALCEAKVELRKDDYYCNQYLTDKNVNSDFGDCFVRNLPPYEDYCRLEFSY